MDLMDTPLAILGMLMLQGLGLSIACLVRLTAGSRVHASLQWLCIACLGCVAASTMIALISGTAGWFLSGATLCAMVLAATCDFGRGYGSSNV